LKKLNLAKVRSAAIGLTIAIVVGLLAAPGTAAAAEQPRVELLWLPARTTVSELARWGYSPGLMSAGLGTVPPGQTYLDVSQGNRVFDSLYDGALPPLPGRAHQPACGAWFEAAVRRAETAPAEIEPNLLGTELHANGISVDRAGESSCAFGGGGGLVGYSGARAGLFGSEDAKFSDGRRFAEHAYPTKLLIAVASPVEGSDAPLAIGIQGPGFDGDLTSETTRTDGYVLSTDIAPTVLRYFGLPVPDAMSGQPITSEGSVDVAAIDSLDARMAVISHRRGPVIGIPAIAWVLLTLMVALVSRGALARPAVRVLGLSVVYLPLVLLAGAALEPGQTLEAAVVFLGCPLLGALTLALLRGYRALAVAAGLTIFAYAVDMIAGSPLTSLSLLGPNPGLGVRFYGIGNELEALLGVLVVAGTGAGLAGFRPRIAPERAAAAFLGIGLVCAFLFAAGDFGADVGAAIVFPVGAAAAAAVIAARGRRWVFAVIAVPCAVVGLLALIDLVTGANSHFTRSVLDAGGLHSLGDVAQRRLQLSAKSFARPILLALLPIVFALAALAWFRRAQLAEWLRGAPAMRAGLIGAVTATVVGTLANDSGALLLEIGSAYLLVFVGFAWTEAGAGEAGALAAMPEDAPPTA
jgi:hypothetical protein